MPFGNPAVRIPKLGAENEKEARIDVLPLIGEAATRFRFDSFTTLRRFFGQIGQCYDQNFWRFLPIFGEKKLAFFYKTNIPITIFNN
jgi:hypothetical protein